ncbi:hypothetical protein BDR22DRAFT_554280 [Usnea florida]
MASSSSSKTPAASGPAEQKGSSTVYNQYEMTLPFCGKLPYYNGLECRCQETRDGSTAECVRCSFAQVKEMALRQTEKRWDWFSEAFKLDKRLRRQLGTLGYLPLEIRDKIWHAAIEDCMDGSVELDCYPRFWGPAPPKRPYKWKHGPMDMDMTLEIVLQPHDEQTYAGFGLNIYSKFLSHRSWQTNGIPQLREASPDVNIEVESVLVSTYPFRFSCPVVLRRYLNTASAWQMNRLRSIIIELSGCCRNCCDRHVDWPTWFKSCGEGWIACIERLPPAIKSIEFQLGWNYLFLGCPSVYAREVLARFEIVSKYTRRLAPNAEISVSDTRALFGKHHKTLDDMVDEVEQHSEDYKRWFRESREKSKSQEA